MASPFSHRPFLRDDVYSRAVSRLAEAESANIVQSPRPTQSLSLVGHHACRHRASRGPRGVDGGRTRCLGSLSSKDDLRGRAGGRKRPECPSSRRGAKRPGRRLFSIRDDLDLFRYRRRSSSTTSGQLKHLSRASPLLPARRADALTSRPASPARRRRSLLASAVTRGEE